MSLSMLLIMLLKIYIGTTAVSWAIVFLFNAACEKRLKREGYKYVETNKSFEEKLANFISTAFKGSIPIYNILNSIVILCMGDDKLYKYMEEKLLEQGKIYKPKDEPVNTQTKIETSTLESQTKENEIILTDNDKKKNDKKINDMTDEERNDYLEREFGFLFEDKKTLSNDSLDQQGPVLRK